MGIFSNTALVEDAAVVFARTLESNPYYPFKKWDEHHLTFDVHYKRFYLAVSGLLICTIALALWIVFDILQEYLVFVCALIVVCLFISWQYRMKRTYTLNHITQTYTFWENGAPTYEGHIHNVYVRLRTHKSTTGYPLFFLLLNGYNMDSVILTSTSRDVEAMRKLGRKLAEHLNINYFDERNISRHHVVRHPRPEAQIEKIPSGNEPVDGDEAAPTTTATVVATVAEKKEKNKMGTHV